MTTRKPTQKEAQRIPVRRPTRPGTFQPGAHAAAAARASQEKRRASATTPQGAPLGGPLGAPQGAPLEAPPADRIPDRLGVQPDSYSDAAAVVGLERAATVAPPSATIEIERLAPAWARGYLEPVTTEQIARFGTVREYLRQTWGGGLYSFRVKQGDRQAWTAEQVQIAGPPKWEGADLAPPPPPVVAAPPMPAPPAQDDIRSALGRILERLEQPRQVAAAAAAAAPALGDKLAEELETWHRTNERIGNVIRERLEQARPNPEPEPDDDDDDDDDDDQAEPERPRGIGDVAESYFRQWLERVMPMPGGPTHKAPGAVHQAASAAAVSGTGPPAEPVPAERIP